MRYMFSKSALNQPFESRATMGSIADPDVTRFDKKEDPANLAQNWRYEGPIGKAQDLKRTNGTYWLPQKMPKVPYWDTDNLWDTPGDYNGAYNRHCPYRKHIMAKAVLYMPFHRDAGVFKTFDPAHDSVGNTDQAKFWGKPYWATGAGGAMGCHSPANPPWAFPGVVLNERYGPDSNNNLCPTEYTEETHQNMNDDCKWAAWAPNVIERWDFETSSSPGEIGSSQNYWKPQVRGSRRAPVRFQLLTPARPRSQFSRTPSSRASVLVPMPMATTAVRRGPSGALKCCTGGTRRRTWGGSTGAPTTRAEGNLLTTPTPTTTRTRQTTAPRGPISTPRAPTPRRARTTACASAERPPRPPPVPPSRCFAHAPPQARMPQQHAGKKFLLAPEHHAVLDAQAGGHLPRHG